MRYLITLVMALGLTIGSAAAEDAKFKFKMTTFEREGTTLWKLFPEAFTEKMKLATDGAVEVQPYSSGVIAGIFEAYRAVEDKRADMAFTYPAFEINERPASAFISDIPGGMGPHAKILWVLAGGGQQLWTEYRHSHGLHGLFCGVIGSEVFANSHKRVQSLADFKGFRYRTAGANTVVMQALGAAPTTVPGPEVFTMLERKGIDGAEYLDPYQNFTLGFHKIAKYVIYPGAHAPGGLYEVVMRKETWDSLPPDIQQKFQLVCDSVLIRAYADLNYRNAIAMQKMAETNELVELDPEVIEAFRKEGRNWVDQKIKEETGKSKEWMEKFAESYYGFRQTWTKNNGYLVVDHD